MESLAMDGDVVMVLQQYDPYPQWFIPFLSVRFFLCLRNAQKKKNVSMHANIIIFCQLCAPMIQELNELYG